MNKEDIIRRFLDLHPDTPFDMTEYAIPLLTIRHLAGAIAAAEREECAKMVESRKDTGDTTGIERDVELWNLAVRSCANAIRARGHKL